MISSFKGEWEFLSNFYRLTGALAPSLEHHYQAAKTDNPEWKDRALYAQTPGAAKRIGRLIQDYGLMREDFHQIKRKIMLDLVRRKFKNPKLRELLLSTGKQRLVEGNTWQDSYWGVCNGKGENWLGRILMQVREEIRNPAEIDVLVENRTTHIVEYYLHDWQDEDFVYDELRDAFSFHPNNYQHFPSVKAGKWDGKISLLSHSKVPTGLFLAIKDKVQEAVNVKFNLSYRLEKVEFNEKIKIDSDRDYQVEQVVQLEKACQLGGGILLAATGTGKTRVLGMLFKRLRGNAVMVVDELTLMDQARKELAKAVGEEIGQIGGKAERGGRKRGGVFEPRRITVATVQTLYYHKHDPRFQEWASSLKLMAIDEMHIMLNKRVLSRKFEELGVVAAFNPLAVIGCTATLQLRLKHVRTRAYALAGPVCFKYTRAEASKEGWLTDGIVVQVGVRTPSCVDEFEYMSPAEIYTQEIAENRPRNAVIASLARELVKAGRVVAIIVERTKHIRTLSAMLQDVPHRLVYGKIEVRNRILAKEEMGRKELRLIIVNTVFKKGIDLPTLDAIVDGTARKDKNDCEQKFGRLVRLSKGKLGVVYFDIADIGNSFYKATKSRFSTFRAAKIKTYKVMWDPAKVAAITKQAIDLSRRTE